MIKLQKKLVYYLYFISSTINSSPQLHRSHLIHDIDHDSVLNCNNCIYYYQQTVLSVNSALQNVNLK